MQPRERQGGGFGSRFFLPSVVGLDGLWRLQAQGGTTQTSTGNAPRCGETHSLAVGIANGNGAVCTKYITDMRVTNKSWAAMLRKEEKNEIMSVVNDMCTMSMDQPFLFDCAVRFSGIDTAESVTFCMCDHEQYGEISASYLDNRIFYYVMSPEEFEGVLDGGEDFVVTDIYDNTYEAVHLDSL